MSEEETAGTEGTEAPNIAAGEGSVDAARNYAANLRQQQQTTETADTTQNSATDEAAAQDAVVARRTEAAAVQRQATDDQLLRASVTENEQAATNNQLRNDAMNPFGAMMMFLQLFIAIFTGDTSGIDRAALGDFSEALGFDRDRLGNQVDRVNRGEVSGFRAAAETFRDVNPDNVDYDAVRNINIGDIVGRNDGPTLLHPDLIDRMESDPTVKRYVEMTFDAAEKHDLDGAMLANQFWQESRFNPNAVSPAGAVGIAQFMPHHSDKWGFSSQSDFRDPAMAIEGGARFMANQTEKYGSQSLALVAYNGGGKAVEYADNNIAGNGVTIGQWMDFMEEQRRVSPGGRPGLWKNETYGYIGKIDSQYWSPELIARAQAANDQALASIGREPTPADSATFASAYRAEDGELREGLFAQNPMGENNITITSDFGPRDLDFSRMHHGVDFRTRQISPDGKVDLEAQQPMVVLAMGHEPGFGNRLIVGLGEDDKGRMITAQYAHLDSLPTHLTPGQVVQPGEHLVTTGSTGRITGPHLDYQMRIDAQTVDPMLAFETDLSDSRNGDRLIASARNTLNGQTSGTYNAMIAPALQNSSVQQGLAQLDRIQQQQAEQLLAQQRAEEERLAAAAESETPTQVASATSLNQDVTAGPMGTETPADTATQAAFAVAMGRDVNDPPQVDAAQPAPLTTAFGSGEGTDQTQTAAVEDTAPEEVLVAANTTVNASAGARI